MSIYFYLVVFLFVTGLGGALCGIGEWIYHGRKERASILWALGVLCLVWYQIPTLLSLAGWKVVLTDFNPLFSLALPVAFLGFGLIYLGSRSSLAPVPRRTIFLFLLWFIAALCFYGFYYAGSAPFTNVWPIVGSNVLFFIPIFLLNFLVAIALCRVVWKFHEVRLMIGAIAYVISSCFGFVRNGVSFSFGLTYPPQFAALRFSSPPFLIAQFIGLVFLFLSFYLLHTGLTRMYESRMESRR